MPRAAALLALVAAAQLAVADARTADPARARYELTLEPDLDLLTFRGRTVIRLANPTGKPLQELPLHVYPNARGVAVEGTKNVVLRKVLVDGQAATWKSPSLVTWITLPKALPAGASFEIDVTFDGVLPRMKPGESDLVAQSLEQLGELFGGLLGSESQAGGGDYGILAYGDGILSFGNWYPQLVPWEGGSWQTADESGVGDASFAEAADYQTTVVVPDGAVVAASGHRSSLRKLGDGRREHVFLAPAGRSVAVEVSTRFLTRTARAGSIEVTSHFLPGHEESGQRALDSAVRALVIYEKTFGAYPWKDLDVVEAPLKGGAGGVEFTGLVTCASSLYGDLGGDLGPLLAIVKSLSPEAGEMFGDLGKGLDETLEFVVAHEVAHQWWNAAVGSDSRKSPFLDEALANFSAVRYFARAHGEEAAKRQRDLQLVMGYRTYLALGGKDAPVSAPASSFDGTMGYAAVVYGKGALFFEDLVVRYGEEAVLSALARYYEKGRHRVVAEEDLRRELLAMRPADEKQIAALWQRWIHETHGAEDVPDTGVASLLSGSGLEELLGGGEGGEPASLEKLLQETLPLLEQLLQEPLAEPAPAP